MIASITTIAQNCRYQPGTPGVADECFVVEYEVSAT